MNSKLRKARQKQKLSMADVAKYIGVSVQTVYNYEMDRCNPTPIRFKKIKEILKLAEDAKFSDFFKEKTLGKYGAEETCSREGCDRKPVSRGMCMSHYVVWWRKKKRHDKAESKKEAKRLEQEAEQQRLIKKYKPSRRVRCKCCGELFNKEDTFIYRKFRYCTGCGEKIKVEQKKYNQ